MTTITHAAPSLDGPPPGAPVAAPWGGRMATGLGGVLLAAMMSGLNNRVGALTLVDMAGGRGIDADAAHWLGSVYAAAEVAAMPIAAWFAVTFSFRRFHLAITLVFLGCALLLPSAPSYGWMVGLRAVQGFAGGAMIPLLMSAALRFLPPSIKLQGLGLYSLTATFAPNLAFWLAASWVDGWGDWRLAYWQVVPVALFTLWAVWWGIPQDPVRTERLRELDWPALLTGPAGLVLLALAMQEGQRLDWFHSPFVTAAFVAGGALLVAFVVSEWFHHLPFIRFQLLARRNIGLGLAIFIGLLIVIYATSALPSAQLAQVQGFRPLQIAPIGLVISLPQLVLAPLVSMILYWRWVDARWVVAIGLALLALSCWLGADVTSEWMAHQFWLTQACQMIGQPLAVIPFLYLATSVAAPMEGPFISGLVNMLRCLATLGGGVAVNELLTGDGAAHLRGMIDRAGLMGDLPGGNAASLLATFRVEAVTLSVADGYRLAGILALLLIPPTLSLTYISPPNARRQSED